MASTSGDWGITAALEAQRVLAELDAAHHKELEPAGTLSRYWKAYVAMQAAVGALVESELRAGMSWEAIASAVGARDETHARRTLAPLMAIGEQRLRERLPHA
jgi:hypothetical protein